MRTQSPEAVIIGAGIVDIPLCPVDRDVFDAGSHPLDGISMALGGDAANEAVVLSRLGHPTAIVSKVGADGAGDFVLSQLERGGVDTRWVVREDGLDTGINVVLVRPDGERGFVTNRNGSLRRLSLKDILPAVASPEFARARIACLASLFVSPMLTAGDTAALFEAIRARGLVLCADTTRPKRGETVDDIRPALRQLDYFFPNLGEARLLTGRDAPDDVADALLDAGVRRVALKLGDRGCLIAGDGARQLVPACPGVRAVDTTGAGDTFAAGFMAALLEGKSFADCARFANAAASACVESVGATAGAWTRSDVEARFKSAAPEGPVRESPGRDA